MLNPFPSLLIYGFFVPTFLRVVVAGYFVYIGYFAIHERRRLAQLSFPIVGRPPMWLLYIAIAILGVDAVFLFIGLGTQWAALVGALLSIKQMVLERQFNALPRSAGLLLFIICLSLLFSGAGALAFDLPL